MRTIVLLLVVLLARLAAGEAGLPALAPHPRLLLGDARVAELAALLPGDARLAALVAEVEARAQALLPLPPLARVLVGDKRKRLLETSRQALSRVLSLGVAHRLRPRAELRDRLLGELEALCAFSDWHPQHFLDTAEMSAAVAIGYDWLHAGLDAGQRARLRQALVDKGLRPGSGDAWWVAGDNNWNQVCHGGLVCGALAVAEDEPALARALVDRARMSVAGGLHAYAPAGAYPEGPGYWDYGTSYSALTAAALASALGVEGAGIAEAPGFAASFDYLMHVTGPLGETFNYADGRSRIEVSPAHLWAAGVHGRPDLAAWWLAQADRRRSGLGTRPDSPAQPSGGRFLPLAVAWYAPAPADAAARPAPREWWAAGDGPVHLALMRSAWNDPAASFAGFKGGRLRVNHGHLDAGAFVFDADGVRWAHDLGMEREIYDRDDAWATHQDSKRWKYLRTGNAGHNTLTLGGAHQRVDGVSPLIRVHADDDRAHAVVDLAAAYGAQAAGAWRGLALVGGRRHLLVQDDLGATAGTIQWTMLTRAQATIAADGRSAVLVEDGRRLGVRLLAAPDDARLVVRHATPPTLAEHQNEDFRRLLVELPAAARERTTLAVLLVVGDGDPPAVAVTPLAEWAGRAP